jgi:hypothetical protein
MGSGGLVRRIEPGIVEHGGDFAGRWTLRDLQIAPAPGDR